MVRMSHIRRYYVDDHPTVIGAYTIKPYVDGVRLIIASKARAEVLCHQRNAAIRAKEGSKILS